MDISILEDLGLTNAEIKVYLALLGLGTSTAGPVLEKTGLQNSVVHMTLHKLVERGFISFVKKGKVRHYQAADPSNILKFIEEKKSRFESILPQLLAKQQKQERQEVEIFESFRGFKNMMQEFVKDGERGDEYSFFSFHTKNPENFRSVWKFYDDFDCERKRRGFITRGIVPSELKEQFRDRDQKTLLYVDFPVPTNLSIFRNKIIMTPFEDKMVCFLVHSRQLAESFRQYFYSIWNQYKK